MNGKAKWTDACPSKLTDDLKCLHISRYITTGQNGNDNKNI